VAEVNLKEQSQFAGLLPDAGQCWIPAFAGMTEGNRPERPMAVEKTTERYSELVN
jgi:hypothetical protein